MERETEFKFFYVTYSIQKVFNSKTIKTPIFLFKSGEVKVVIVI